MDNNDVRLGIIGLGNWSRQIFQAVDQLPEAKIAACYSRYPDTREAYEKEYHCVACGQYEQMTMTRTLMGSSS